MFIFRLRFKMYIDYENSKLGTKQVLYQKGTALYYITIKVNPTE